MKVLVIGDIVGNPGRRVVKEYLPIIRQKRGLDYCIANGENAAGGRGITYAVAQEIFGMGVDCITLGNHTWAKREIFNFIDAEKRIIRPANYLSGSPGKGSVIIQSKKAETPEIGVINLQGSVYMDPVNSPFEAAVRELEYLKNYVKVIIVDFHAEATSEKCAMAWYLDGRVSAVLGTHTHVQTADERILPRGTAFITDIGMTGPYESIIGVDHEIVTQRFVTQQPVKFEVSKGRGIFCAVLLDIDESTGKSRSIERIQYLSQEKG